MKPWIRNFGIGILIVTGIYFLPRIASWIKNQFNPTGAMGDILDTIVDNPVTDAITQASSDLGINEFLGQSVSMKKYANTSVQKVVHKTTNSAVKTAKAVHKSYKKGKKTVQKTIKKVFRL
jgi:hypothetical protein